MAIASFLAHWKAGKDQYDTALKAWQYDLENKILLEQESLKNHQASLAALQAKTPSTPAKIKEQQEGIAEDQEEIEELTGKIKDRKALLKTYAERASTGIEPACKKLDSVLKEVEKLIVKGKASDSKSLIKQLGPAQEAFKAFHKGVAKLVEYQASVKGVTALRSAVTDLSKVAQEILDDAGSRIKAAAKAAEAKK